MPDHDSRHLKNGLFFNRLCIGGSDPSGSGETETLIQMPRPNQEFQTVRSEGGLLPPDLLRRCSTATPPSPAPNPKTTASPPTNA